MAAGRGLGRLELRYTLVSEDLLVGRVISHIRFDGPYMWVLVGSGKFREFFRRTQPPDRPLQRTAARFASRARGG